MRFFVQSGSGVRQRELDVGLVLLAGYTGRDQESVRAHIAELAAHGVPAPGTIPAVYAVPGTRLVTSDRIAVHGGRTAGEAEFFVVDDGGQPLIGVGSDHTDRELEEHSVVKAKQTCDKPVCGTLWPLDELTDHTDELRLSAEVHSGSGWELYQDGKLDSMLTPTQITAAVTDLVGVQRDAVVFSGTLPLIGGELRYGSAFRATLEDPVLDRRLVCEYTVHELPDAGS